MVEVDPLVSNGLGSPFCGHSGLDDLPAASRQHCETSGFVAAGAPTGNFGIDVHIETGVFGLSSGGLLSAIQDLFVTPVWMALVWAAHALVVMLEWAFTVDLLDSTTVGSVGAGLRHMQATLALPLLGLALSVASILALYNGLVRRRIAQTLADSLLTLAMIVGGMWVIADPTGTVGSLAAFANQASLGTLAAATGASPSAGRGTLAESMNALFAGAVEAPWCYLEFGDVAWCREPGLLDPRLRRAGLAEAVTELRYAGCPSQAASPSSCATSNASDARALQASAQLLRGAQSNGAIFLALPANGSARNSISNQTSLLHVLCESADATSCRGPTGAQAEFRTNSGTWSRVGGLLLIAAGLLGLLLLFGFIAVHLLTAALFSLLYLLLAPAMILAPAFGDGGRALFRNWATRLLGSVVTKLLFAFLLGVVLQISAILDNLDALGWWTQWLLSGAFWWGAFLRRHRALGLTEGAGGLISRRSFGVRAAHLGVTRRVTATFGRLSEL